MRWLPRIVLIIGLGGLYGGLLADSIIITAAGGALLFAGAVWGYPPGP
jgi:hypothetical protein